MLVASGSNLLRGVPQGYMWNWTIPTCGPISTRAVGVLQASYTYGYWEFSFWSICYRDNFTLRLYLNRCLSTREWVMLKEFMLITYLSACMYASSIAALWSRQQHPSGYSILYNTQNWGLRVYPVKVSETENNCLHVHSGVGIHQIQVKQ